MLNRYLKKSFGTRQSLNHTDRRLCQFFFTSHPIINPPPSSLKTDVPQLVFLQLKGVGASMAVIDSVVLKEIFIIRNIPFYKMVIHQISHCATEVSTAF